MSSLLRLEQYQKKFLNIHFEFPYISLFLTGFSPVAEVGKLSFPSTHGSEKVWYRILVEQNLLIIA